MKCSECRWSRSSPPEDDPKYCVHPDHMVLDSRGRAKTHISHWNSRGECRKHEPRWSLRIRGWLAGLGILSATAALLVGMIAAHGVVWGSTIFTGATASLMILGVLCPGKPWA